MEASVPAVAPAGPPATSGWRRLVVVSAICQTLAMGVTFPAFSVLVLPVTAELGIGRPRLIGALTLATLIAAVAAVPVGRFMDRHGGRLLMVVGAACGVIGIATWASAQSVAQLYAAFVLLGLCMAFSAAEAGTAVLVMATTPRQRDTAILVSSTITGLGTAVYYPLTGWLEVELGWRATLLVYAGVLAVVAVPGHLWVVPGRVEHRQRQTTRRGLTLGPALRSGTFWILAAAFLAQASSNSAFALLMVAYFHDVGHSLRVAATLPVALGLLQVVSRLVLMPLAPRVGMPVLAMVACALQGVGMLAMPLAGVSVPLTLLCLTGVGLGFGLTMVSRPSLVASSFGALQFASIMAVLTVLVSLARSGSPLVGSLLSDWRMVVVSGALSLVAAALLLPIALRSRTTGEYEFDPAPAPAPVGASSAA
ncbi:MFS transporter [Nocardioides jishulii]|uniref:MFS transporter n=1 Tax=Nocardioides jishulii TaxID=2575440 RepID=A0A4U2YSH3_9ACTN|nr:MFS transporter [Nocardioides jishulii]QCX26282.1 MFS transporter [Nocardioides jishulii]TKI63914.1 MFS transporter [Nocardioides jishulii]